MTRNTLFSLILLSFSATAYAFDPAGNLATGGVLDEPLTDPNVIAPATLSPAPSAPVLVPTVAVPYDVPAREPNLNSADPVIRQEAVQNEVDREMAELSQLSKHALTARAESGERAAQVVLGIEFAREAQSLNGIPAAANQAAEDAVRWYSLAAQRGFPGAPSLDYAGVKFYPVRVQRAPN